MSNWQDDIFLTILKAKDTSGIWAANYIAKEKAGETVTECCYMKLVLLVEWIDIMQCYYSEHFNAGYGNITPDVECLTLAQAQSLLGKIKSLIGVS